MRSRNILFVSATLLFAETAGAQEVPFDPEVDQKAVDEAVRKGVDWLLQRYKSGHIAQQEYVELVLLALIHGGAPSDHPVIAGNFNKMVQRSLQKTYNVGLRALILEKVNRKVYQRSLAEIAQFFSASQCQNGQWEYTGRSQSVPPVPYVPVPTKQVVKEVVSSRSTLTDESEVPPGKEVKIPPPGTGRSKTPPGGDNSNTQYAVMGLFAASRAAVVIPLETWKDTIAWFESAQNEDGGWGYDRKKQEDKGGEDGKSTGSMTVAGLTGLIVAKYYLGEDWKTSPSVQRGLDWLGRNFSVLRNPGGNQKWHYYYLYGLERVGVISGLKEFGGHRWYKEGAEYLLAQQLEDGSWKSGEGNDPMAQLSDTCFAILFLKRGTPKLDKPQERKGVVTGTKQEQGAQRPGEEDPKKKE